MPKVTGPLFSVEARGALGKRLIYQRRPSGAAVYGYKKPRIPLTVKQMYQRWDVADYVFLWQSLSDGEKAEWEQEALGKGQSGYSYFLSYHLRNLPDLLGRWHLDERTGTVSYDSSKRLNHATIYGASHVPALIDYGLSFDGVDNYVETSAIPPVGETFTAEIWVKRPGLMNDRHEPILYFNWPITYPRILLLILPDKKIRIDVRGQVTGFVKVDATIPITDSWHHLTITRDLTLLKTALFLDGLFNNSTADNLGPLTFTEPLFFGHKGHWNWLTGTLDQAKIYNRALSPEEIKIHSERRYP